MAQAKVSITSVVEEDCEGVAVLVEFGSSDDSQVLQREVVELVQCHQHIARHFTDGLWTKLRRGRGVLVCVLTGHYTRRNNKNSSNHVLQYVKDKEGTIIFSRWIKIILSACELVHG